VNNRKCFDKKKAESFYRKGNKNYGDQGNREDDYLSIDKGSLIKRKSMIIVNPGF